MTAGGSRSPPSRADWSVRETEERAREANAAAANGQAPRAGKPAVHPDQAAAASEIADAIGAALGTEVKVRPRGTGLQDRAGAGLA